MLKKIPTIILFVSCFFSTADAREKSKMTGKAPYASAYENLLPESMRPAPAKAFHPSELQDARIAVVPSANFNEWARIWEQWFDMEGKNYKRTSWGFGGGRGDKERGYEHSSNPRNFSDQVILALQPHVGEIVIATDLFQARDAGADYFLILDGWLGTSSGWNTYFHASGGVHLLNAGLEEVFSAQGDARIKYENPPLLKSGSSEAIGENIEKSSEAAMSEMSRQVLEAMQIHLGRTH